MVKCWLPHVLLVVTLLCAATGSYALDPVTGRILLASNQIEDARFKQTVILLVGHDHGSMGVILNRPTGLKLSQVLTELEEVKERATIFHFGGPLDKKQVLTLLRTDELPDNSSKVVGRTGLSDLKSVLGRFNDQQLDDNLRVYLGYSGWAPGQLNKEITRGDWLVLAENEALIYDPAPKTLWQRLWDEHRNKMGEQPQK